MIKEDECRRVASAGVVGGVPGGVPGGAPGGVIGGIIGSVPSAAPPPPPVKEAPKPVTPKTHPCRRQCASGETGSAAEAGVSAARQAGPYSGRGAIQRGDRPRRTIQNLTLVSGHPLLVPAATEAVRQWVYQPTLLNGEPVEVVTQIDVNFTLSQ